MLSDAEKTKLAQFLSDDAFENDVTAASTPEKSASAAIKSVESVLLAGVEEALFLFGHAGLSAQAKKTDGQTVHAGEIVLTIAGSNRAILSAERTALNVLGRMSGVATLCQQAQKIAGSGTTIALTRKTVPGFGAFDKRAALIAGIWPHRLHLAEAVLIKENHLRFFASPADAVLAARKAQPDKTVEIEVEDVAELQSAVLQRPDMVLLDNFSLGKAEEAVAWCRINAPDVKIELSGGIRLSNVAAYAALKPDY
ncbi:MAG: carboxylating nicotinate-nucleotide diphosphorylase, partial [Candidatus Micrarchaeota archaeon]|nr:carboxylating nicotinate-nucleotide diphosphorylase [Candidatus Micrarchaeota archaeon]